MHLYMGPNLSRQLSVNGAPMFEVCVLWLVVSLGNKTDYFGVDGH